MNGVQKMRECIRSLTGFSMPALTGRLVLMACVNIDELVERKESEKLGIQGATEGVTQRYVSFRTRLMRYLAVHAFLQFGLGNVQNLWSLGASYAGLWFFCVRREMLWTSKYGKSVHKVLTCFSFLALSWKDGDSTIDLTFATENLASRTIHCKIVNQLDCDSDHLPVDVAIDWHYQPATPTRKRLWAKTNVQVLRQKVKELLPNELEAGDLSNNHDIDAYVAAIVKALDTGINESTPWSNPSPRSIQGFDEECKEIWKEVQQLRRTWQRTRQDDDYEAYRKACNRKGRHIRKILRDAHRQRVEEASTNSSGLWKLVKWAKNRHIPSSACTPALVMPDGGLAEGPEERRRRCDSHSSHLPHRPTCPI
ncbi:hypothetical protein ARSEF4850_002398 [Beauveria asiatica]